MEHLTNRDFDEHRARRLSADRLMIVSEHLLSCPACRSLAEEAFDVENTVREFQEGLEYQPVSDELHPVEDLPWFVDGRLDSSARLEIERHLSHCAACSDEVQDLRRWSRSIDHSSSSLMRLSALAAGIAICVLLGWSVWRPLFRGEPDAQRPVFRSARPHGASSASQYPVALRPEWQDLVSNALRTGRVPFPGDLRELSRPDTYRDSSEQATRSGAVQPSATAVDDPLPDFSWSAIEGHSYEVVVTAGVTEAARSPRLSAPHWRPITPLARGDTYRWQVVAHGAGGTRILPAPPSAPAVFRILTAEQHQEIEDALREHPQNHLLAGLLYARAGVVEQAHQQLALYSASTRSPVATRLLHDLENER